MLLPSMTYKEMYDCLAADFDKVKLKKEYLLPRVIREFKKEMKFPAWKWYEYTIPATGNKYIIFFYAETRSDVENPKVDSFCIVFDNSNNRYVFKCSVGLWVTDGGESSVIREVQVYTSHFFDRYKERWFKDTSLSSNETACRYFSRNEEGKMPIEMNEDINRHLEKYGGGARFGYRVRDGFCFAMTDQQRVKSEDGDRPIAQLEIYKTYMDKAEMAESQLEAIDQSYYEALFRYEQVIQKEFMSGTKTFTLEK